MHLLLIRHGETDWNNQGRIQGHTDVPLNATGIRQAEQLAKRLATEEKLDVLYTSPLQRASATAEIIGKRMNLAPIPDERLIERAVGKLEGLDLPEVRASFPEVFAAWREERWQLLVPGAEDQPTLFRRVTSFLDMLRSQHSGRRVGVVTHGGTLGMILASVLGLDIQKRFPFRIDNTSLSKIDFDHARPRIELLNDTCHLQHTFVEEATGEEHAESALETE